MTMSSLQDQDWFSLGKKKSRCYMKIKHLATRAVEGKEWRYIYIDRKHN